jgi:hypothetical protein
VAGDPALNKSSPELDVSKGCRKYRGAVQRVLGRRRTGFLKTFGGRGRFSGGGGSSHLEVTVIVTDPKVFTKPVTIYCLTFLHGGHNIFLESIIYY